MKTSETHSLSFWESETWYGPADVAIVGSGLLGLWTAYRIARQKPAWRVVLLEARPMPAVASTRNAGFACFGSPTELLADAASQGEDAMWELVAMRWEGIRRIRQDLGDAEIGYEDCGGFECLSKRQFSTEVMLKDQLAWLNAGLKKISRQTHAFELDNTRLRAYQLTGFDYLVHQPAEGALHSGKLVQALLRRVLAAGVVWLPGHACYRHELGPYGWLLHLNNGHTSNLTISANRIVLGTNAALQHILPAGAVYPARGQVLVSPPVPELKLYGTFHAEAGYYYFRHISAGRFLIGGARNTRLEEEQTNSLATTKFIRIELELFIRSHLPQLVPLIGLPGWLHWSGTMAMTPNKQPILHALGNAGWAAMACNGMGVALTPVFAEKVTNLLLSY